VSKEENIALNTNRNTAPHAALQTRNHLSLVFSRFNGRQQHLPRKKMIDVEQFLRCHVHSNSSSSRIEQQEGQEDEKGESAKKKLSEVNYDDGSVSFFAALSPQPVR